MNSILSSLVLSRVVKKYILEIISSTLHTSSQYKATDELIPLVIAYVLKK